MEDYVEYSKIKGNEKETKADKEVKKALKVFLNGAAFYLLSKATLAILHDIMFTDWEYGLRFNKKPSTWCVTIGEGFELKRKLTNEDKKKIFNIMKTENKSKIEALIELGLV